MLSAQAPTGDRDLLQGRTGHTKQRGMSDSLGHTLDAIRVRTENLIELCEALREQNDLLKLENQSLRVALETSQDGRKKLDERFNALKIAKSLAESDEKSL